MEWLQDNWQWTITTLIAFAGAGGFTYLQKKASKGGAKWVPFVFGLIVGVSLVMAVIGVKQINSKDDPTLIYQRGKTYYDAQEYAEAIRYFKQAEKVLELNDINRASTAFYRGWAHCKLGEYKKAIDCFHEYLAICNSNPQWPKTNLALAYDGFGCSYEKQELFDKALDSFFKAYENAKSTSKEEYMDNMRRVYESTSHAETLSFDDWLTDAQP